MAQTARLESIRERFDISLIRPPFRLEEVHLRRGEMSRDRLTAIRKALRTFHSFETLAGATYRFQMSAKRDEPDRVRIAAMCNEMTHLQDFQVKLYEFGWRPSKIRWFFWLAAMTIGTATRLMGTRAILRSGIWLETRAVDHYNELLETVEWDDDTRAIVEKNCADEIGHVERWSAMLKEYDSGGLRAAS